jgi:hypothetical protein
MADQGGSLFDNIKQNRRRAAAIAMASALAGSLALVPQAVAAESGPIANGPFF